MKQTSAPLAEALARLTEKHLVAFDVPGHKQSLSFLSEYFGENCLRLDMNSRPGIDYLCQPQAEIKEAEILAAEAFGAAYAYFMVGGTTASVQAMVMSVCNPGDKIILPRNVHYSVINAVIVAGAIPIYINPTVHARLGISLGMRTADIEDCLRANPDAKAILVNNPTYYGICPNLKKIVEIAHAYGVKVLADEAHGAHFYFHEDLPMAAMHCGADMAAVSMHKTGGSLTQSSILLSADTIDPLHVNNVINLLRTTSASYLLLASLDLARRYLATEGREVLGKNIERAERTREKINALGGYYAFAQELINGDEVFAFDPMKISVHTVGLGLAGIEVYSLLRETYGVQVEFGDVNNFLAIAAIGDSEEAHQALVNALKEIREGHRKDSLGGFSYTYISPQVAMSPRDAFYSPRKYLPVAECEGKISADYIMCYPPGIPFLAPGELVTQEIISHILCAHEKGCTVTGLTDKDKMAIVDGEK